MMTKQKIYFFWAAIVAIIAVGCFYLNNLKSTAADSRGRERKIKVNDEKVNKEEPCRGPVAVFKEVNGPKKTAMASMADEKDTERIESEYNEDDEGGFENVEIIYDSPFPLENMDADFDREISREEYAGEPGLFDMYDTNKNDVIDEEDQSVFQKKFEEASYRQTQEHQNFIDGYDLNGDGGISMDEIDQNHRSDAMEDAFSKIDTNGDGAITVGESQENAYLFLELLTKVYKLEQMEQKED